MSCDLEVLKIWWISESQLDSLNAGNFVEEKFPASWELKKGDFVRYVQGLSNSGTAKIVWALEPVMVVDPDSESCEKVPGFWYKLKKFS